MSDPYANQTMVERLFHYTPSVIPAGLFILIDCFIILAIVYQTGLYYIKQRNGKGNNNTQQQQQAPVTAEYEVADADVELGSQVMKPTAPSNTNTNTATLTWERHGIKLLWIVAGTATCLIIGLGLRIQMINSAALTTYILHQALLIISPNALAFVNYSLLGLIIRASETAQPTLLTSQPFYLRSKYVAPVFLLSDITSFIVQSSSAPMLTSSDPAVQNRGNNLMIVGLFIQLTFFTLFCFISAYVNRNLKYVSTRPTSMKPLFTLLYFTIICLYIRSVYRAVEFITGYAGPVAKLEWMFYVLDMVPVTLAMACYAYFKPQGILQLAQQEVAMGSDIHSTPAQPRTPMSLSATNKTIMVSPAPTNYGASTTTV